MHSSKRVVLVVAALTGVLGAPLQAQSCIGRPSRSSIAFVSTAYGFGSGVGGHASWAGKRMALDLGGGTRNLNDDVSGFDAGFRLSFIIPASKLLICPGFGINGAKDEWDASPTETVTSTIAAARAGVGLGLEQTVFNDVSLIPFVGVYYRFRATVFDVDAPGETFTTADTASHVQIEYGMMAHYRFLFAGIALERTSDTKGSSADLGRIIIGLTSSGNKQARRERR